MPVPCQLVKPLCMVIGLEFHDGLGIIPSVPPVPGITKTTPWISIGWTVGVFLGDTPSPDVFGHTFGLIKRGSDTKYIRPHICLGSPPLPAAVTPIADLGLVFIHIALGATKEIWGCFSVKANITAKGEPVGVIWIPYSPVAPYNQLVCNDIPCDWPCVIVLQMPNTVFAGMTLGDYVGSLVTMLLEMALSFAKNAFFGWNPVSKLIEGLAGKILGKFATTVSEKALSKAIEKLIEIGVLDTNWSGLGKGGDIPGAVGEGVAGAVNSAADTVSGWFD